MATLANTYRLIDDYTQGLNPNTVNGPGGAGTGMPIGPDFVAPTIAAAITIAHIVSTAFQRPVRVVPVGSPGPYTLVVGLGPAVALTQVPSGITY